MKKLLIIDYSVLIYNITASLDSLNLIERLPYLEMAFPDHFAGKNPQDVAQDFVKAQWVYAFYRGPDYVPCEEFTPVLVKDSKPYWRSTFFPDYKGNRPPKTDTFYSVKATGERLAKSLNIPILEEYGYEADDIAASLVKHHNLCRSCSNKDARIKEWADLQIMLWTVDSDWHQLVSNTVTWYNTGPWLPLVRGPREAKAWALKRLKVNLNHPQDIVPVKCTKGDKSDNLPPGTKPFFIDLFNPHPDYRLLSRENYLEKIWAISEAPANNMNLLKGAQNVLRKYLA